MTKIKGFFKKLFSKVKKANYLHYFALSLVGISLLFALFRYSFSYERLWNNLIDFFGSIKYYFQAVILGQEDLDITITSVQNIDINKVFGFDIEALIRKFDFFWLYFWNSENFSNYFYMVLDKTVTFLSVASLAIPVFILVGMIVKKIYFVPGNEEDKNKDTKYLVFFKAKILPVLRRVFDWFVAFKDFLLSHSFYIIMLVFIWLLNVNATSLVFGVLSFYFYFVSSFEFSILGDILLKLGVDLLVVIFSINIVFWFIIVYISICKALKSLAYAILNHHEMQNRGFINAQPLVTMSCGTMGSSKTKSVVDMALSTSVMFRQKALEILIKNDMKFPNFPWLAFEDDLKSCYINHIQRQEELAELGVSDIEITDTIYNLASTKYWVAQRAEEFFNNPLSENLWGYDIENCRHNYDDDLKITHLFEALIEYAQAYLIYTVESSLIFGNLPVREDIQSDDGFLPMWNTDFFHRSPVESAMSTRLAHIFDYDMFRLGKKMVENNKNSNAFEFGIVVLTEIGKERKNSLENRELKKQVNECNQNNDLFNHSLKMIRHRATVAYFPFVRIMTDEQRPESWGADARDLCTVIHLGETSELKILYKGLFFDSFIHDILYPKFESFYLQMRNLRGDNTLLVYLLKNIFAWTENRYEKLKNRFGYYVLPIETVQGSLDGAVKNSKYYISTKKAHSNRYSTDSHADLFERMALNSGVGLHDFVTYRDTRQEEDELELQNAFFYIDMTKWATTPNV